jgi:glycosyltransferase involved in cell wall biosynthesis
MALRDGLVTLEHSDPDATVLVLTNAWPHPDEPRYGIFIKRQIDSLVAAGLRCDVLFIRGFRSPLAYLAAAAKLLRLSIVGKPRYRFINGHSGETLLPALFYLRRPKVITFYGDDLLGTPREDGTLTRASRFKSTVLRHLTRLTTATMTQSRQMEDKLPTRVRQRNQIVPSGIDVALFRPHDRHVAREQLGWDPDEPVALFAADPELPRKRYGLAAAACEEARKRGMGVRLHVAEAVPPDAMPLVMSAADCLLLTSKIEGSPNVVKEAVMCNLPVVATPAGDVREVLDGITPSFVCEPSGAELAEALLTCIRGGRSDGRARSSWLDQRQIANEVMELFDRVGANGTPRARA